MWFWLYELKKSGNNCGIFFLFLLSIIARSFGYEKQMLNPCFSKEIGCEMIILIFELPKWYNRKLETNYMDIIYVSSNEWCIQ